jgi:glycerol-3-phosphate dehydrogenase (NAD(P)+)
LAEILILGAGVMGSALAVPAADNGHSVTLAATPVDEDVLAALIGDRAAHPRLGAPLPDAVAVKAADDVTVDEARVADLVVLGVSSAGIGWAVEQVARLGPDCPVAVVTKGLVARGEDRAPETYADTLPRLVSERGGRLPPVVGIGGPCIARELAERRMTAVIYAAEEEAVARDAAGLLATPYYEVSISDDLRGVESCAALKNLLAIGVSAMMGAYTRDGEPVKNPVARAFQRAVEEMAELSAWIGGRRETAFGLAGLGDLHVTVGGGRNSRFGAHLGRGLGVEAILNREMAGETVEGVDVGRNLFPARQAAGRAGTLPDRMALTDAILAAIGGKAFDPGEALGRVRAGR